MKHAFIVLLALCLCLPVFCQGAFTGKATRVVDGDTITVVTSDNKKHTIRLEAKREGPLSTDPVEWAAYLELKV